MHPSDPRELPVDPQAPLGAFSQCHVGITAQLEALQALPELVAAARRARQVARGTLALIDDVVFEHHREEEQALFPAVLASAAPGAERERVEQLVQRLTAEHRALESLCRRLEPGVRAAAHARDGEFDAGLAHHLVRGYLQHARFEEREFLPLAQEILRRDGNHVAALALALHLRHVPAPVGHV